MDQEKLNASYDEIVEEIQSHLRRGSSVAEAKAMYADFCSRTIGIITQLTDLEPFIKDIVIALADKFKFNKVALLKGLLDGTSAHQLAELRAAQAVSLDSSAHLAWQHITRTSPEIAVTIIALSFRLSVERKLKKLLSSQSALEGEQRNSQRQEQDDQNV